MAESPLEQFFLEYVEAVGGVSEAVEPQVYDVILPPEAAARLGIDGADVLRAAFDPEALADHAGAQLVTFGNPILDRIFADAQGRGRVAKVYLSGFNLSPHDLPAQIRRGLEVTGGAELEPGEPRVYHVETVLFGFQGTFISDEKEQELLAVAVDLHHGRLVRHMEEVLERATLSETCPVPYPHATRMPLGEAYALARQEIVRSTGVAAHARRSELEGRVRREAERVRRYFADLRTELAERRARAETRGADASRFEGQAQALDREEQARLAELARKMSLQVQVRLLNLLSVVQPKLAVPLRLVPTRGPAGTAEVMWDPATQKVEALACAGCRRPTLVLAVLPAGRVGCLDCGAAAGSPARRGKRVS